MNIPSKKKLYEYKTGEYDVTKKQLVCLFLFIFWTATTSV
jgi:hypothetical protein